MGWEDEFVQEVLTVKEVAHQLRCSLSQVYRLFAEGKLEGFRLGEEGVRIHARAVTAYMERQANAKRVGNAAPPSVPPKKPRPRKKGAAGSLAARLKFF
jgi:excisionase family DNA binding protein